MRAVVQRVDRAAVRVDGEMVGSIERGLLVYLGAGAGDDHEDVGYLAEKVANLRVFPDERRPMNRSLLDEGGEALVISQFTLFGDCRRGRRPSFNQALEPKRAAELIEEFVNVLKETGIRTGQGSFGATMLVESVNQGPVTILLDSKKSF